MPTAYPDQTRYAFRPGVTCVTAPGTAVLLDPPHSQKIAGLHSAHVAACRTLNLGPTTAADLSAHQPGVETLLEQLVTGGWLTVTVCDDTGDRYTIAPFARPGPRPAESSTAPTRLSKFAVLHRDPDCFRLEHPLGFCDLRIHDPRLLALLDGSAEVAGEPDRAAARFVEDLRRCGFLQVPDGDAASFETLSWSTADLWFHRRSTLGERVVTWEHFGPTEWARGRFPQPAARRENYPGEPVALSTPDLAAVRARDPALTAVVEGRVSTRVFDDAHPVTLEQLGELLYRTARTRWTGPAGTGTERPSRPYPSAGGVYELELYPVVREVAGLAPGMYHYDSFDHLLRPVAAAGSPAAAQLMRPASATLAGGVEPQVLLVIAARCGRIMWTYEQIGYATVLKDAGVLMQTVYLVATAMGLGACAQGFVDTAAFTAATGVDERRECGVGSIVVGSPGAHPPP